MHTPLIETLTGLIAIATPMLLGGWLIFGKKRPVFLLYLALTAVVLAYLGFTHVMTDVGGAALDALGFPTEKPKLPQV